MLGNGGPRGKILHLIPTLEGGGAERQLSYLVSELQHRGWDVTVASLRLGQNAARLEQAGVRVRLLPHAASKDPLIIARLIRLAQTIAPDAIQTWLPMMDILGGLAARVVRVSWIATERADPSSIRLGPKMWYRQRRMVRGARVLVANSENAANFYRAISPRNRVVFIPNGVPFDDLHAVLPADRSTAGVESSARLVILAGRLSELKDVDTFVRALPFVRQQVPEVQFIVFGVGPLRESLQRTVADLGVEQHMQFLGYVDDLPRWVKSANVVVSSSLAEGNPNMVLETMACGIPLVLSDIPPHRTLARDGALYFPPRDARALAERVVATLQDPAGTANRTQVGIDLATPLSIGAMVSRYEEVYREIIGR
jgi:glycosyltransferase involved in cell wall biosynthesis